MPESNITSVEQLPKAVVVHVLASNLGKSEVDAVCDSVDAAREEAPALPFVIDLAKVSFAGSLSIGVLVGVTQEFRNHAQRLIFVSLQTPVRDSFHVARLNRVMEILPDVAAALKSIEGASS
jgi:anti-anti-sigma factor